MTPQAREIIREVAESTGTAVSALIGQCRLPAVVYARMEVARRLYARGYSTTRIGETLNHDHTTIVFYLGRGKKKPPVPKWRTPVIRHLRCQCHPYTKKPPAERSKPRPLYLAPYAGADMTEYRWTERPQCLT